MQDAEDRGNGWFTANFKVEIPTYGYYYLYAYKKYRTFRDKVEVEHAVNQNPQWYSDVAEYLLSKQKEDGSWETRESTAAARRLIRRSLSSSCCAAREPSSWPWRRFPTARWWAAAPSPGTSAVRTDPLAEVRNALEDEEVKDPDRLAHLLAPLPDNALAGALAQAGGGDPQAGGQSAGLNADGGGAGIVPHAA